MYALFMNMHASNIYIPKNRLFLNYSLKDFKLLIFFEILISYQSMFLRLQFRYEDKLLVIINPNLQTYLNLFLIMKASLLLQSLLLITSLTLITWSCPTQRVFEHSDSCVFNIDYNDTSCEVFTLRSCSYSLCVGTDSQGNCFRYKSYIRYTWGECTRVCCDQDVNYPLTTSGLNQCQDYLNMVQRRNLIIGLSIFGGIVFFVAVVALCYRCKNRDGNCCQQCKDCIRNCLSCRCCEGCCDRCQDFFRQKICPCCQCLRRPDPEPQVVVPNNQKSQKYQESHIDSSILMNSQWKPVEMTDKLQNKLRTPCPVTLDDNPRMELSCGHMYNRIEGIKMLRAFYKCAICRRQDISIVKMYCQKCCQFYRQFDLQTQMNILERQPQYCSSCSQQN